MGLHGIYFNLFIYFFFGLLILSLFLLFILKNSNKIGFCIFFLPLVLCKKENTSHSRSSIFFSFLQSTQKLNRKIKQKSICTSKLVLLLFDYLFIRFFLFVMKIVPSAGKLNAQLNQWSALDIFATMPFVYLCHRHCRHCRDCRSIAVAF